jgi:hypothetical protein
MQSIYSPADVSVIPSHNPVAASVIKRQAEIAHHPQTKKLQDRLKKSRYQKQKNQVPIDQCLYKNLEIMRIIK